MGCIFWWSVFLRVMSHFLGADIAPSCFLLVGRKKYHRFILTAQVATRGVSSCNNLLILSSSLQLAWFAEGSNESHVNRVGFVRR